MSGRAGTVLLVGAVLLTAAAPAGAATWSKPRAFDTPPAKCLANGEVAFSCVSEPAPRVAVTAGGAAVAAWVDRRTRVRVSVAARPGRFGAPVTVAARGLRPNAAIAPDGTATVVWQGAGGVLRFARKAPAARAFTASRPLAPRGGRAEDDYAKAAAGPDGAVTVVYESGRDLRAVTISPAGVPGAPATLGPGGFGRDSTRVAPDGTLAACCIHPVVDDPNVPPDTDPRVAVHRPGTGWTLVPLPALGRDAVESVFATATDLLVGTLRVEQGGDTGLLGIPSLARASGAAAVGAPLRAPVVRADHALAPDVAIDGSGRSVLLFQEKTRAEPFSRSAPVYASVAVAGATRLRERQRLTAVKAYEPAVRPLGRGAVAVWQEPRNRWGVAIERDGIFRRAQVPKGPGPSTRSENFSYAYDVQAAGRHAVLAWVAVDGSIRVSELR